MPFLNSWMVLYFNEVYNHKVNTQNSKHSSLKLLVQLFLLVRRSYIFLPKIENPKSDNIFHNGKVGLGVI